MTQDEDTDSLQERIAHLQDTVFTLQLYQKRLMDMLERAQQEREMYHGVCERAGLLEDPKPAGAYLQ